ncbi:hypothetical protein CGC63_13130 [Blautia hansenii DSM 20583]|nr:hypothetical protein CGC63_13130 [Blautia hansenii DSM 20583]
MDTSSFFVLFHHKGAGKGEPYPSRVVRKERYREKKMSAGIVRFWVWLRQDSGGIAGMSRQ